MTLREHIAKFRKLVELMPPEMHDVRAVRPILDFNDEAIAMLRQLNSSDIYTSIGDVVNSAYYVLHKLDEEVS